MNRYFLSETLHTAGQKLSFYYFLNLADNYYIQGKDRDKHHWMILKKI